MYFDFGVNRPFTSDMDIGCVKPGAFDHAHWRRADLWAYLPQHLTVVLCFKAGRADHSFTLDLHMTNRFCWIYLLIVAFCILLLYSRAVSLRLRKKVKALLQNLSDLL